MEGYSRGIRRYDIWLFIAVSTLISLGLIMVYSTSAMASLIKYGISYHYALRQFLYVLFSLFFVFIFARMDYHVLRPLSGFLLFGGIFLLAMVYVPHIGLSAGGSRRWLNLKIINIQPSEFVKIIFVIYLAKFLEKYKEILDNNKYSILFAYPFMTMALIDGLLLKQPDFGSASIMFFLAILMLFVAGISLAYLFSVLAVGSIGAYFLILSVPYRRDRILAFLHPFHDKSGVGFQIIQSIYAFGRGGIFGVGLGHGKEKLIFLPTPYSDFIFSSVGEELGLIGVAVFILLFLILAYRGLRIAVNAPDLFGTFLAYGLTFLIVFSAFINIGVTMGALPTKGLALPLISYGGSSMLASCIAIGILLNISSQSEKKKEFE